MAELPSTQVQLNLWGTHDRIQVSWARAGARRSRIANDVENTAALEDIENADLTPYINQKALLLTKKIS